MRRATLQLDPVRLRRQLVSWHGLAEIGGGGQAQATRDLLARLRCIQLDPLDVIGTNADLVAHARLDGLVRGQVYDHLLPGHAFEHFAKERCLLPPGRFAHYRHQAVMTPWWRATERMKRVDEPLLAAVLAEVRERGPLLASELTERGRVTPIDWSGWKSSSRAAKVALEVLWRRCQVVVFDRSPRGKRWAVAEVGLGEAARAEPQGDFHEVALADRIHAAGMLPRAGGPWWSMLSDIRTTGLPEAFLDSGRAVQVGLPGTGRIWLADPELLDHEPEDCDGRMRVLGPLDPMLWDRLLVRRVFDFEYVWEVYKPAEKRRWGWYVCPLLQGDRLVGRLEARRGETGLRVDRVWREVDDFDEAALDDALQRLWAFQGT